MVIIVAAVAIVAVLGAYLLLRGEEIPVYPGAQLVSSVENMGVALSVYSVDASMSDVMAWYRGQIAGWEKMYDNTIPFGDPPVCMLAYKKGDAGLAMVVGENAGATQFSILEGPWSIVESIVEYLIPFS